MSQSRKGSFIESLINIAVGFGISIIVNVLLLGHYGVYLDWAIQFKMTAVFTVVSIGRSYFLRRIFNGITRYKEAN